MKSIEPFKQIRQPIPATINIKTWGRSNGDAIVYDNQMGAGDDSNPITALGGGSIVIYK